MGVLPERRVDGGVRVPVLDVLLVVQDSPERLHAGLLLRRIHVRHRIVRLLVYTRSAYFRRCGSVWREWPVVVAGCTVLFPCEPLAPSFPSWLAWWRFNMMPYLTPPHPPSIYSPPLVLKRGAHSLDWLQGPLLRGACSIVRLHRGNGEHRVRQADLPQYQSGLAGWG